MFVHVRIVLLIICVAKHDSVHYTVAVCIVCVCVTRVHCVVSQDRVQDWSGGGQAAETRTRACDDWRRCRSLGDAVHIPGPSLCAHTLQRSCCPPVIAARRRAGAQQPASCVESRGTRLL